MINLQVGVKGRYNVKVKRADGSIKQEVEFENLLTNSFFTDTVTRSTVYLAVGTGATPPAVTDVDLETAVGAWDPSVKQSKTYSKSVNTYTLTQGYVREFTLGSRVGTFTEVGASFSNTSARMFSRALMEDAGGNPISLVVTANDQLVITYTFTITFDDFNTVYNGVMVDGVSTTITMSNYDTNSSNWGGSGELVDPANLMYAYRLVIADPTNPFTIPPDQADSLTGTTSGHLYGLSNGVSKSLQSIDNNNIEGVYEELLDTTQANMGAGIEYVAFNSNTSFPDGGHLLLHFNPTFTKDNQRSLNIRVLVRYTRV
jgi:hypothetical protein